MTKLNIAEQVKIFSKYLGQYIIIDNLLDPDLSRKGLLIGIRDNALQVRLEGRDQWIRLHDEFTGFHIKLLLKPLKALTPEIIETANNLPIQNFITQYYISMGFDMPVFLEPEHPFNCKYVKELGLAEYEYSNQKLLISA